MPKGYLSPAYHYWNPCAVAGCDETTHNNLYLDVLEPYLAACGIQYKRGPRRTPKSGEDGDALMLQAVRESDAWGADVHYVSHTNAANGGVRGYRLRRRAKAGGVYPEVSPENLRPAHPTVGEQRVVRAAGSGGGELL